MLSRIQVKNLAVIEKIECAFDSGLTVLTGETGAGKSLLIDALSLVSGSRADPSMVRDGAETAEIIADFWTKDHQDVEQSLSELEWDDHETHVLTIRKVISKNNPAKTFINGHSATLQDLKQLVSPLINIHGQGSHEKLRRAELQHKLYDRYLSIERDLDKLNKCYKEWQIIIHKIKQIESSSQANEKELDFLNFQLTEFESMNLEREHIEELESRHRIMNHIAEIKLHTSQALNLINDDHADALDNLLIKLRIEIDSISNIDQRFSSFISTLDSMQIDLKEIESELNNYQAADEINASEISLIEKEMQKLFDLSRKHRCDMYELINIKNEIVEKISNIEGDHFSIDKLKEQNITLQENYYEIAKKISHKRNKNKVKFEQTIEKKLLELGFKSFEFKLNFEHLSEGNESCLGTELVQFYISPNPGQPLGPLDLIASGGEMSRICLALELIDLNATDPTTIIFDEVDAGIGGAIAEIVGTSLNQLSKQHQVLCITHLPQVACQGQQHLKIFKTQEQDTTSTQLALLNKETRLNEIARMLGGVNITKTTKEHAKEMLA